MNANKILEDVETNHERVSPYIRESADVFHDNEGELFTRAEATQLLTDEVDISLDVARDVITQLVGDTVDPIVQVARGSEKYIGIVEFHEFDGAYGYINYDDQFGKGKRVVCQQCVNDSTLDSEVTHATANDPMGSFADGASWDELLAGVHQHYEQAHDAVPEDVETGATLASGTTIGGNTAFHAGNETNIEHDNLSSRTHSGDSITPNDVTTSTLEATDATVANRDVADYLSKLQVGLGEARFEQGLSKLGYDGGWFDVLEDESLVDTKTDVEGFTGSVTTISSVDYGQFSSPFQTLNFVPSSVVVGHDADQPAGVTPVNGDSFGYLVESEEDVTDATLKLTGRNVSNNRSKEELGLLDGDTLPLTVNGNTAADIDVSISGNGSDTSDPAFRKISETGDYNEKDSAISDDGTVGLVSVVESNTSGWIVYAVDASDPSNPTANQVFQGGNGTELDMSADGTTGISTTTDNAYIIDLSDVSNPSYSTISVSNNSNIRKGKVSDDGSTAFYSEDSTNGLVIVDTTDQSSPSVTNRVDWPDGYQAIYLDTDNEGDVVLAGVNADSRDDFLFDTSDPNSVSYSRLSSSNYDDSVSAVVVSRDGSTAALGTDTDGGQIYDISDPSSPSQIGGIYQEVNDLDISDDGSIITTADDGGYVRVKRISDGENIVGFNASYDIESCSISGDSNIAFFGASASNSSGYVIDITDQSNPIKNELTNYTPTVDSVDLNKVGSIALLAGGEDVNSTLVDMIGPAKDPSVTIDGQTVSTTGEVGPNETFTDTITNVGTGTQSADLSLTSGGAKLNLSWADVTKTTDPSIEINSAGGTQTISYSGTIADGTTEDLSGDIDESLIDGSTTVTVNVSETVTSPVGQVGLDYSHEGFDAGGLVKYKIEDGDGNAVVVEDDEQVDVSFTSSDLKITPILQNGLSTAELYDYAVYFQ